jgi:hypothetical protein
LRAAIDASMTINFTSSAPIAEFFATSACHYIASTLKLCKETAPWTLLDASLLQIFLFRFPLIFLLLFSQLIFFTALFWMCWKVTREAYIFKAAWAIQVEWVYPRLPGSWIKLLVTKYVFFCRRPL